MEQRSKVPSLWERSQAALSFKADEEQTCPLPVSSGCEQVPGIPGSQKWLLDLVAAGAVAFIVP